MMMMMMLWLVLKIISAPFEFLPPFSFAPGVEFTPPNGFVAVSWSESLHGMVKPEASKLGVDLCRDIEAKH